jgi:hypothetical protein
MSLSVKIKSIPTSLVILGLFTSLSFPQTKPDSCTIKSLAKDRRAVKNRTPAKGENYRIINNGNPITIPAFYELVCGFAPDLPDKADVSDTDPIDGFETVTVTVRGFLLAAKFEGGEDKDLHAQIAVDSNPHSDQLIIEVPAGRSFCDARKALWKFVTEDRKKPRKKGSKQGSATSWRLTEPIEITVTGFLFLDAFHIGKKLPKDQWCVDPGGRGLRFPTGKKGKSFVKGLWEIHPITSIKAR